ncbi:MAG: polyprenyl synthetase family protein [Bacteroidales bacterium]|nr:polyprenyl synthetase family protein [Bacteroidales bacterium]
MNIAGVKEYLGAEWTAVQGRIAGSLESDIDLLDQTNRSILSHAGKQLRPMLALLAARACSADGHASEATVRYAAAAELLHNATLLHDDVADDSDQRRGVPTIRSLMGPTVSVLLGDYWLVKAMELILGEHEADSKVIRIFSKTLSDLAEGELLQLQKAQSGDTVEEDYLRIIYSKTASLFEASCVSAALSVGASEDAVEAMRAYSVALGRAFQIKDDLLDYDGTESVGKPLGVDILEQKMTMPLLGALVNAGPQEDNRVRALVKDIVGHPEHRDEIVAFVKANGGMEYASERLDFYVNQAVEALAVLPESFEKTLLVKLARYTANREK